MRRRALAITFASLLASAASAASGASCGPVAGPPPSPVPINACPEHACNTYASSDPLTCSGGACVASDSAFDFTLVVSLPESLFYGPGMTVPIASFLSQSNGCNPPTDFPNATCLQIPSVIEPTGELLVEKQVVVSADAGASIDTSLLSGFTQWSLPIHVEYRPLWPPPPVATAPPSPTAPAPSYAEAASLGLPLDPIEAMLVSTTFPGIGSPRGTLATQWKAPMGPGFYERDITPDDDAFPVVTATVQGANDVFSSPMSGVGTESVTVTRMGESLAGFTVYLRDASTLRRVSSRVTLGDPSPESATLLTPLAPFAGGPKVDVVVAPPAGSPIPYLADRVILQAISEPFPALPPPVLVSGTVVGPGRDAPPVRASLVLDSIPTTLTTAGIITSNPTDPARALVHYSTATETDANGSYSVMLPPGTYDVFVTPAVGSNAGATSVLLSVGAPLGSLPPIATGKTLTLAPLGIVAGMATIADHRPLAGATVEAQPAVSLAATTDPRRWPTARTTTTDAQGRFAMVVDPGTYDIVVQPAGGTGFPWTTISSQEVVAGETLALAPMIVPAPMSIDLVLHDPGDNPLIRATVRAFAPASGATSATTGGPLPVIEIGSWLTDASGHLTMLLARPH